MKFNIDKKIIIYSISLFACLVVFGMAIFFSSKSGNSLEIKTLEGKVVSASSNLLTVEDGTNIRYTFDENISALVGDELIIKYTGDLDKSKSVQDVEVIDYTVVASNTTNGINNTSNNVSKDMGIFSDYYTFASNKLKELSLNEKIGQMLLVRYPDSNQKELLKKYGFGGYVFFEKDFKNKTKEEVQNMMRELQSSYKIPILTATDEEGGKVVRVSSNTNLASSKFKSPKELYDFGGFTTIRQDTIAKSKLLKELGINVNLAPVVDVVTDSNAYMYDRSIGADTSVTSEYAKTVIEASKGTSVSYTLKHFPGYGNNTDTHTGTSTDSRSLDDIKTNDLPPFEVGIEAGAEAVLVSHNIVTSIDSNNPASISKSVHNLLRNNLGFTGVIITDDLDMEAVSAVSNPVVKAVLAGNDLIIVTDYEEAVNELKTAVNDGNITESQIDDIVLRILAWKYYKGLIDINQK
ncbi:MAG: glycoside hydrolase family 3 protein [Bacilli bacterium]